MYVIDARKLSFIHRAGFVFEGRTVTSVPIGHIGPVQILGEARSGKSLCLAWLKDQPMFHEMTTVLLDAKSLPNKTPHELLRAMGRSLNADDMVARGRAL